MRFAGDDVSIAAAVSPGAASAEVADCRCWRVFRRPPCVRVIAMIFRRRRAAMDAADARRFCRSTSKAHSLSTSLKRKPQMLTAPTRR